MENEKKVEETNNLNPSKGNDEVSSADIEESDKKKEPKPVKEDAGSGKPETSPTNDGGASQGSELTEEQKAKNAERRRKQKAKEEEEQKAREEQIRKQAVFDVERGQVKPEELTELSLDKVETEDNLFLVKALREAKANGSENPSADAYKSLYKKQQTEKAALEAKKKQDEELENQRIANVAKDQANFTQKFGKTTGDVVKNEPEFMELFGELIDTDKGNFTALYTVYSTLKKGRTNAAKKAGSFPTSSTGVNPGSGDGSTESDEDFKKRWKSEHGHW